MQGDRRSSLPVSQRLPRGMYWIMVGLAVWLVLSVWGFAGSGYTGLVLSIVSLFLGIAVALPLLLALIARRRRARGLGLDQSEPDTLKEWLTREFSEQTGTIGARAAAVQVLLPLAAVAFGMTIFALIHHFDIGA